MHFLFMKDLFSQYETDIRIENDIETIHIRNKQFEDEIVVHYFRFECLQQNPKTIL